jgi:2-hydroxychromene-2-carboxylate isomerase
VEDPATLVRLADASGIGGHALLAASDDAALATQEAPVAIRSSGVLHCLFRSPLGTS